MLLLILAFLWFIWFFDCYSVLFMDHFILVDDISCPKI